MDEKDAVTRRLFQSQATELQKIDAVVYPYEILKVNSKTPVAGIDVTRREVCFFSEIFSVLEKKTNLFGFRIICNRILYFWQN